MKTYNNQEITSLINQREALISALIREEWSQNKRDDLAIQISIIDDRLDQELIVSDLKLSNKSNIVKKSR